MTAPECPRCGAYLDPDGSCLACADGQPGAVTVLDQVAEFFRAYVAFPSDHAAVATALWAAHTHLAGRFESTPRLALLSPEKQCGKSRVLELLELVCAAAETLSDASPAYLFRRIAAGPVTILVDETDAIWKRGKTDESAEALRSIVNAGHRKSATVGRVEMNGQTARLARFPVYAPAALAGIGSLPDTILDRAVILHMRRRPLDHKVREFRERYTRPQGEALRDQLAAWAADVGGKIGESWPDMPPGVTDRPADVWEPLLVVADLAGGDWPRLARDACAAMVAGAKDDTETTGTRLLTDLRAALEGERALWTGTILDRLNAAEDSPWAGWHNGAGLNARDLAKRLRDYEIKPRDVKIAGVNRKGYYSDDLADAWARYLPQVSATTATSATALARQVAPVAVVADTPETCPACGEPVDPALVRAGITSHPNCGEER